MKISNKVNLFRGGVLVISILLVALAVSFFASNQAKAEISVPESNGTISAIEDLNSDIDVNVPNYDLSITGVVIDSNLLPITNASVKYYKEDGTWVEGLTRTTSHNGSFDIDTADTVLLPGYLEISHEGYKTVHYPILAEMEEEGSISLGEITMYPQEDVALFSVKGLDHHKILHCVLTMTKGSEQKTEVHDTVEISGDDANMHVGATYYIDESGNMNIHYVYEDDTDYSLTIQPVGEDGYVVDKWSSNGVDLVVGELHEITTTDPINNLVSYKPAQSIAQTGDSLPLAVVAISIIALLAGGLMLRKSFK